MTAWAQKEEPQCRGGDLMLSKGPKISAELFQKSVTSPGAHPVKEVMKSFAMGLLPTNGKIDNRSAKTARNRSRQRWLNAQADKLSEKQCKPGIKTNNEYNHNDVQTHRSHPSLRNPNMWVYEHEIRHRFQFCKCQYAEGRRDDREGGH